MKPFLTFALVWIFSLRCLMAATFTVTTAADSGAGSLRQAMLNANATAGADQITFNISGGGPRTIAILSPLPILAESVVIDAATQPGYAGIPLIEINAAGIGALSGFGNDHIFRFDTSNSVLRGFVMNRHGQGGEVKVAVYLRGPGSLVDRNFIGTDLSGTAGFSQPALYGISITSSNNVVRSNVVASSGWFGIGLEGDNNTVVANYLGTDRDGVSALGLGTGLYSIKANNRIGAPGQGNVFGGCTNAIVIRNPAAVSNIIQGNFIGTRAGGTAALPNLFDGITVALNAQYTLIGGTNAGEGNVISGNRWGIVMTTNYGFVVGQPASRFTTIAGNNIGLNAAGNNFIVNRLGGIWIDGSPGNQIGGLNIGARNLISGNDGPGLRVSGPGAVGNAIEGNYVGLRADGVTAEFNFTGIVMDSGATENRVGTYPAIAGRNIISGNSGDGVRLQDVATHYNFIYGNYVGTDASGSNAVANTANGINIAGSWNHFVFGGVISGNGRDGIAMDGATVAFNFVHSMYIGTDVSGRRALPNRRHGVFMANGAYENFVGEQTTIDTIISGNADTGVYITGAGTSNNVVRGALIGLSATDSLSIPNASNGVAIVNAPFNLIGATNQPGSMRGNVISGQGSQLVGASLFYYAPGILISGQGSFSNRVEGNFIGTDRFGTRSVSNGMGIVIRDASRNRIGGNNENLRNVVSGNIVYGLTIEQPGASNNLVWGNFIGTDAGGTNAVRNGYGILIDNAPRNQIGGYIFGGGNVVSGNGSGFGLGGDAISLVGTGAVRNLVLDNRIGTDVTGTRPLGNEGSGVYLIRGPASTQIGDIGYGNTIAYNGYDGVFVAGGGSFGTTVNNSIYANRIFSNGQSGRGLGINLATPGEGVGMPTLNDPLDADTGPNNLQNFPIITNIFSSGGNTIIRGYLESVPNLPYVLDFYRSDAPNPSGYGEGEFYLGYKSVGTDGTGRINFSYTNFGVFPNAWFTATTTATFFSGDTSEFSPAYQATAGSFRMAAATRTFTENVGVVPITIERVGGSYGTAAVSCFPTNGTALNGQDFNFGSVTVTFNDGETSKFFNIIIVDDALDEDDETFTLGLSNPTGGTTLSAPTATTVTILDNDPLPGLSVADFNVVEGTGGTTNAIFTISLNTASGRTVAVNYATANLTAVAPEDYANSIGTLTFPAGVLTRTVIVPIVTDDMFETDEQFTLNLSSPINAVLTRATGTCTILNDDSQPRLSAADIVVAEGTNGTVNAIFTVTLSNPSYLPVSFNFATTDGTALAGSDYVARGGSITVPPGLRSTNILVTVTADLPAEPDEDFFLKLNGPINATISAGLPRCVITELRFLTIRRVGNDIELTFTTGTGHRYAIQRANEMPPAGWSNVPGLDNLLGIGAPLTVLHSGAVPLAPPGAGRFYRVFLLP